MRSADALRVLHIIPQLSYYGAENFVAALATAQAAAGMDVGVMTMYSNGRAREPRAFAELPVGRTRGDTTFPLRMIRAIGRYDPDVVHTHAHNGKYWGRTAALAAGARIVIHTEHNSAFSTHPMALLGNRILHPFTRRIVAVSHAQGEALVRAEPAARRKIAVIPNGIAPLQAIQDDDRARVRTQLGLPDGQLAVFLVGRLEPVKNQQLALRTIAAVERASPGVRLFLVGEGSDEQPLRRLCAALRIEDRVTFCGFRSDARDLLAAADALLLTSLNEAMPLAALEALFAGVPVVSTPWNGAREVLADAGAIAESWEPDALAHALRCAIGDPRTARALGARGLDLARTRYDIAHTERAYQRLYEECQAESAAAKRRMIARRS